MKVMSGNLKEEIVDLWDEVIPKLIAYIEANEKDWKQGAWEVCTSTLYSFYSCAVIIIYSCFAGSKKFTQSKVNSIFNVSPQDLVLKLLSKTLDVVNVEQWIVDLGTKFGSHLPMYAKVPDSKVSFAHYMSL